MDIEKLDINAVCFGILCNFTPVCGEEKAKEAVALIRSLQTENEKLQAEVERQRRSADNGQHLYENAERAYMKVLAELERVTAERDAAIKRFVHIQQVARPAKGGMSVEKEKQRDKLIEIIVNAKQAEPDTRRFTEFLADFLLGYGVFVPDDGYDIDRLQRVGRGRQRRAVRGAAISSSESHVVLQQKTAETGKVFLCIGDWRISRYESRVRFWRDAGRSRIRACK